jgi:hypothetical protein
MNTLTNEQVGLQIAKQTINKLNKKIWWLDISKIWTGWNKGAFAQANNFNQTIKVSPKAFKVTTFTSAYKKKFIYNEMLQHYNNTLNGLCHEYQHLLNSCDGHTNAFW